MRVVIVRRIRIYDRMVSDVDTLETTAMRKTILSLTLIFALLPLGMADDANFNKSKFSSVRQPKEIDVHLSITDSKILVKAKKGTAIDLEIPYSSIDSISYELAQRHRVAEGASVMVLSLGAGAVLMATKTKSHWLAIEYHEANGKQEAVLQLDKSEYKDVIAALEARTGKKVEMRDAKTNEVNPTADSTDMDEVVPFSVEKVMGALKPAMEAEGCNVKEEKASRIICKRDRGGSERTGTGGEEVTASLEASGSQTRVRIVTGKGFVGRMGKKNWSTSIYKGMMDRLQVAAASKNPV